MLLFGSIYLLGMWICITLKAIYHLIAFFCLFMGLGNKSEIHLTVDENHYIKECFVELASGKIIPIRISKVKWNKPDDEVKEAGE